MKYEGTVYRPPSEASSLIIQVTIGCSHNKCTFCNMYKGKKFKIRPLMDIIEDFNIAREYYPIVKRIFLADGDALILKTKELIEILDYIKNTFPECERISVYATPNSVLNKSKDELQLLNKHGIKMIYMGVESGNNEILAKINKGVNREQIKKAGKKIKETEIKLSLTLISGLGGKDKMKEHAIDSGELMNDIDQDYIGLLTLMLEEGTPLYNDYRNNKFDILTPEEVMIETKLFIENLEVTNCIFRSNHASNYIPLVGTLPRDKEKLLVALNTAIEQDLYKDEDLRML